MAAKGQPFNQIVVLAEKPDALMQGFVTATAGTSGYTMNTAGSNSLVLTRKYLPTWAIIVAIVGALVMLLGLLALLVRNTESLTIALAEVEGGTRVTVTGVATPEMMARLNGVISGAKTVAQE
jgi:hypothetical protein